VALGDEGAKAKPADFLVTDLQQRIEAGTAKFGLLAQLDRPGDPTMDVTARLRDVAGQATRRPTLIEETDHDHAKKDLRLVGDVTQPRPRGIE